MNLRFKQFFLIFLIGMVVFWPVTSSLAAPTLGTPSNTWFALGSGFSENVNRSVYGFKANGSDIYIFGKLGNSSVSKWDGSTLQDMNFGGGSVTAVNAMEFSGSDLYISGTFSNLGGIAAADNIAKWNGNSWSSLGAVPLNGSVLDFAFVGTDLYAVGGFTDAGGNSDADYIAKWNGSSWVSLGPAHFGSPINSIEVIGNTIYVGGYFADAGGSPTQDYIAKWDGNTWASLGPGLNNWVNRMVVIGTDLYVGGYFTEAGGFSSADYIARWDGSTWAPLGENVAILKNPVTSLAVSGKNLLVGGFFTNVENSNGDYFAIWDGAAWHAFNVTPLVETPPLKTEVDGLAIIGNTVYVGGTFVNAGGIAAADKVAAFNLASMPTVAAISRADTNPVISNSARFTVTFSEEVTGVDVGDFQLNITGAPGASLASVSGSGTSYTVAANITGTSGTLRLDLVDNDSILGSSGHPLGGPGSGNANFTLGETYTVDKTATFADVPIDYWAFEYIERLYNASITGGCGTNPLIYCPTSPVTRAQMAVFLEKGLHGSGFTPANVAATFTDTAGHWAEDWIEALKSDGVTSGCGAGIYCPENSVTRDQMAVFLLKAKHGSAYTPPAVGASTGFTDVPTNYWAAAWIKQLAAEAITGGCGGGLYCPSNAVTRDQMAVFLVKTFDLP